MVRELKEVVERQPKVPDRRAHVARKWPAFHHRTLLLNRPVDDIGDDSPMRMREHWLNPANEAGLVELQATRLHRERPVVEHDRLRDPQARLQVLRLRERDAERAASHPLKLRSRRDRRAVVVHQSPRPRRRCRIRSCGVAGFVGACTRGTNLTLFGAGVASSIGTHPMWLPAGQIRSGGCIRDLLW